jgi:hypothetical protein
MALTQPAASEMNQAEPKILAQPSDGKKMPISWISSDAILDKHQNRLSGLALPTVPCILGPFKVHHAFCDWGASMNILPKIVYDCMAKHPLVPTPHQLQLADSVMMQPYGIAKDVLIQFQDYLTLVDFMVVDMDPRQQTSIILGKPFLKSVSVTIDKKRGIINMKVDRVHEKFIYHPQEPRVLLPDSCQPICGLEKGMMRGGVARAHEKSPSVAKQKTAGCYDTR